MNGLSEKQATVVLVHATWADGSSWNRVMPLTCLCHPSRGKRNITVNRLSKYVLATALFAGTAQAAQLPSTNATTTYHRVQVDGVGIFYREAGPEDAPTIVLLHGFPSSSREF